MTFEEIARWASRGESDLDDGEFALMLAQDLAEALAVFEYNTARMFAVFSIASATPTPLDHLRQQTHERTEFTLEELRKDIP